MDKILEKGEAAKVILLLFKMFVEHHSIVGKRQIFPQIKLKLTDD
jgi:hypothetical protein